MLRTGEEQFSRRTSGQERGEGSRQTRVLYSDPYTTSEDRLYCGALVYLLLLLLTSLVSSAAAITHST